MSDKESEIFLIERAKVEEEAHNWVEAAKQYEQAVEIYLQKNLGEKVADGFKKIGFSYLRAVETANTEEGLFKRSENAIKAYEEASNLFKQRGNIAEELECRAEICYIKGFIASNAMEWKSEFNKSLELFTKSSKTYFKEEDLNSYLRTLSRAGMASFSLSQFLDNKKALMEMYHRGIDITEKAWELSIATENFQYIGEIIYSMVNLNVIPIYITNFKKDENYKEYMWNLNEMVDKSLKFLEDVKDYRSLALIYFAYAHVWCGYTTHYIEDEIERGLAFDKGTDLFERSIEFSRKANIKFVLVFSLFWLNWWMLFGQKYNYVQKRILKDVNEIVKLGYIHKHSNIALYFFANFLPVLYYSVIANYSMFKETQRRTYAEKGFEFAQECLKTDSLHPMISSTLYQWLTYSCSLLVTLSPTESERYEEIQKMIIYAEQADTIGEKLEGGLARAAGYSSLYKAYKTQVDITKDDSIRIKMLAAAATALENYLNHTIESVIANFFTKLRLGLLLEGIGIVTGKPESLIKSRELFLKVIDETTKRGFYQYAASGNEYVARIEDRLGNYFSSAEHYKNAIDSYSQSLKNIKYVLLKKRIRTKQSYVQAWNLIETAKLFHKREEHLKAKENYGKACQVLEKVPKYSYEAIYYSAWTFLEEAEQLGKQEHHKEAIVSYTNTKENFTTAINNLDNAFKGTKDERERERMERLKNVAKIRIRYCSARIHIEEARILGKKGEHLISAEKFSSAASQFKEVCNSYKIERERDEVEAVYYLCRAWERMELAEQYHSPERFAEASDLFKKGSKLFHDSKMKLLSSGNSAFCEALEYGSKFDKSTEMKTKADLYPKVKILLREATNSYRKGDFESGAGWALATSTYFDAAWHIIKADVETNLGEKKKLLEVATDLLRSASDLFEEAGYKYKQEEINDMLEMLQKEEKILISALNTIKKPSISESTIGIVAPACPIETSLSPKLSELERFKEEERQYLESKAKEVEKKNIRVFISYATTDSSYFQVSKIAKVLFNFPEIGKVLFWEEDMHDDIIDYMDTNLGKCDIFLLFCSQNALKSDAVKIEWQTALKVKKKIIPVFEREKDIPTLLSTKLGVQFSEKEIDTTIKNIYDLILKKLEI